MELPKGRRLAILVAILAATFVSGTALGIVVGVSLVHTYHVQVSGGITAPTLGSGFVTPGGATAFCNPNDKVVGGGYALAFPPGVQYNRSDVEPLRILHTQPYVLPSDSLPYRAGQQGWWVGWWWEGNTTPKFTIDVWAVCLT